jgi:hypothetical protein
MAAAIDAPSRAMTITLWVLRVLVAALFLFAAFVKLASQPQMVEAFGLLSCTGTRFTPSSSGPFSSR